MKTIGLLGGMSWESTVSYYQQLNLTVKRRLGGLHSAKVLINSVDFAPIEALQHQGRWDDTAKILIDAAKSVERAGADFLMIGTNTMHIVAEQVQDSINIPLLHIADCTGKVIAENGIQTVGLLGTAFTMEQSFYRGRLQERFGLQVLTPNSSDRASVHDIIYQELCLGQIANESKVKYQQVVNQLVGEGAEAIILGCTEIGLLLTERDCSVPLYDTVKIHAEAAVDFASA